MTIYEVPNIEHCRVEEIGDPVFFYRLFANDGWYIHLNDGDEETANLWKTVTGIGVNQDLTIIQIVPESELPEGAEICAVYKPVTE